MTSGVLLAAIRSLTGYGAVSFSARTRKLLSLTLAALMQDRRLA
jgi:hypothetical protein